ncbi:hypothetical protein VOLCADRAFT_64139 [Volvox carteri f. nagariensis]|uniref:E2F-associated phosphoprotein n=1 Tax=Volvox carteri f. nagariensis TaxID=3068 RepID=D8U5F1_VOLCA|nr:uncharacterized protein VOLCADRAFT_64139 [Volvox carteri f. nagariensis]EFJ44907.1 hypothetical protein VOLCADRAFT_64139 [Volvox carteri f. nagariensis]|eukprot:XP_002953878.1 hypothetical protein VOLCADRAFT_64139 [Volvox carteri f. nagariensis]
MLPPNLLGHSRVFLLLVLVCFAHVRRRLSNTPSFRRSLLSALRERSADEEDAVWADQQREGRVSDAVLSCPGCFTTLCIDCQRHEKYHHQYRAMFVMNCAVEAEEGYDPTAGGQAGSGGGGGGGGGRRPKRARGSARYRRVTCGVCGTEVGALEVDEELYHFYHVFPSNA